LGGAIKTLFFDGPAGRLEAILNTGAVEASHAGLVCHPHPLFGGTMHNKVVYHAAKALNGFGFPVLRFNFRGAGLSQGQHDGGRAEQDDVRSALQWLESEFHLPIIFAGFSFGAAVGLRVCCGGSQVSALLSLGTPVQADHRTYDYSFLAQCSQPKLFVSGANDPYAPQDELRKIVEAAAEPKKLVLIPAAGHFFEGKLNQMQAALVAWLEPQLDEARTSL
jgi:alpha/beta superfamily hydrolase